MKWVSRAILGLMMISGAWLLVFGPRPHDDIPAGRTVVTYWEKWTGPDADAMHCL